MKSAKICLALLFAVSFVLSALSFPVNANDGQNPVNLSQETIENIARVLWMRDIDPSQFSDELVATLNSCQNSETGFGMRMWHLLKDMKANPDSFTPSYADLFDIFAGYSPSLTPHQAYAMVTCLGMEASRGQKELPQDIAFTFPKDDRPDFEYQAGWHFFVGSVFGDDGEEYGIELMFWQYSLLPFGMAAELGLTPLENQFLEMHLAVTRAGDRHYRAKPYIVAGTTGLIGFSASPFNYYMGKNYMRSWQKDSLFPIRLRAWGLDKTQPKPVEMEIDITVDQAKPYMLNGDRGLDPSCGGVGTLYYSVSNLPVDPTRSWLKLDGKKVGLTGGKLWYDHQWGSSPSATNPRVDVLRAAQNLKAQEPDGWEWIAVMFDDNTEFTLSVPKTNANKPFYMQTGPEPPGEMTAAANGLYNDQNGAYGPAAGFVRVKEWRKSTVRHDQYQATDTWYPNLVEVTLNTGDIPDDKRQFTLIPIVQSGQEGWFAPGWQYSEGAVYVKAPDGTLLGRGFLELTGYADFRKQVLNIAGMPETEEMMELIEIRSPSPALVLESKNFLAIPENAARLAQTLAECRGRNTAH